MELNEPYYKSKMTKIMILLNNITTRIFNVMEIQHEKNKLKKKDTYYQNVVLNQMLTKMQKVNMSLTFRLIKLIVDEVNVNLLSLTMDYETANFLKNSVSNDQYMSFLTSHRQMQNSFHDINYTIKLFLHMLATHCSDVYDVEELQYLDFNLSLDYFFEKEEQEYQSQLYNSNKKRRRTVDDICKEEVLYDPEIASMVMYSSNVTNLRNRSVKKVKF